MIKYFHNRFFYLESFIRAFRQRNNCLAAAEVGILRGVGTLWSQTY